MKLNIIITAIFLIGFGNAFFESKFNKIKERAKQYYQTNFGDKKWHFLGQDPSAYPGTDLKYRQENHEKWEAYYKCLRAQENSLGEHGTPIPEAVIGYEGESVKFDCKVCLNPREAHNMDSIEWYFGQIDKKFLEIVLYDDHILLSPENKTLNMYNLKAEYSGQYVCILGDSVTVPYYLTVLNGTSKFLQVHSENAPKGPHALPPKEIADQHIIVDTEWSPWSPCTHCDKVGKRHRIGYCIVMYNNQNASANATVKKRDNKHSHINIFKQAMFNESFKLDDLTRRVSGDKHIQKNISKTELELLKVFSYGVPCHSHILPDSIKNLKQVKSRLDEVMIGYCKVKCTKGEIFQVRDEYGKILEEANNSAGIYSMLQGLPPIHPPVERITQYERMGQKVVLICPGNLNSDDPIQWQINSKIIVPEIIYEQSQGRIEITLLDRVVIKKSKLSDSNLYSCWQHNELAGTVRLLVEKKFKMSFNHHIMLFGMVLILAAFAVIFLKAFSGRKYAKLALK